MPANLTRPSVEPRKVSADVPATGREPVVGVDMAQGEDRTVYFCWACLRSFGTPEDYAAHLQQSDVCDYAKRKQIHAQLDAVAKE